MKIEPEAVYAFKRFWALLLGLFGEFILIPDLSIFEWFQYINFSFIRITGQGKQFSKLRLCDNFSLLVAFRQLLKIFLEILPSDLVIINKVAQYVPDDHILLWPFSSICDISYFARFSTFVLPLSTMHLIIANQVLKWVLRELAGVNETLGDKGRWIFNLLSWRHSRFLKECFINIYNMM